MKSVACLDSSRGVLVFWWLVRALAFVSFKFHQTNMGRKVFADVACSQKCLS